MAYSKSNSPYSGHPYNTDEYNFEDNDLDESNEDTDEASEAEGDSVDPNKNGTGQYVELKEQVYQDQLASLKKQLQQLSEFSHPEYTKRIKKIEENFKDRQRLNVLWREYCIEEVEREYLGEKRIAVKEFEEKKIELRENLIVDLEEKKKLIEAERYSIELTGDPAESKPVMTRKLRRRANEPAPAPEKRRKVTPSQLNYLLDDKEIENDLREIARGSLASTVKKTAGLEVKIEDGKLWYERRWFHRGQSVFVEGKNLARFPANVSSVGSDVIWVKKTVDGSKFKIFVSHLTSGKYSIKRRAAS